MGPCQAGWQAVPGVVAGRLAQPLTVDRCGRHDRHGDELPVAGGAVCDFQSRAESTGFQQVVFKTVKLTRLGVRPSLVPYRKPASLTLHSLLLPSFCA